MCPKPGTLNFTPQAGHRPALVLSPASYNDKTSLLICCPLTTQIKNYPFEVLIAGTPQNVVLADQVKSLDWRAKSRAQGRCLRRRTGRRPCEDSGAHRITNQLMKNDKPPRPSHFRFIAHSIAAPFRFRCRAESARFLASAGLYLQDGCCVLAIRQS
jgi:mRNA-degrading endonuclease toxin of MazEF toxin-antitoxin module